MSAVQRTFLLLLDKIQPTQLYINSGKLSAVQQAIGPEPVPVKKLNGRIIFTDGHTRAFAAHLAGRKEIEVFWDEDELDWEAYQICVDWCLEEGIRTIADLNGRVIGAEQYETQWLERCRRMQEGLAREHKLEQGG
jgi:hypothetical protein